MNEELYLEIKERLEESLGYEPSEDEITAEYSAQCDWEYEQYKDDLDYTGDY